MQVLVLGGTQWVGREIAREALRRGHDVTCFARGEAGEVADGARLMVGDRSQPHAYDPLLGRDWDAVIDVTRQPGFARSAAEALAPRAAHLTFVSSCSVYARHDEPGADERAQLLPPLDVDESTPETYGEAKSAIEAVYRAAFVDRLFVVRPGLIAGPGDPSDRAGFYVARAARDGEAMLVPDLPGMLAQVIDARDLAGFVLDGAEHGRSGVFNAVGDPLPVAEFVERSRRVGGHAGDVVAVDGQWLREHEVAEWSGPDSLPLWIADPDWRAFMHRSNAAAVAAGLRLRPLDDTLADVLAWERSRGLHRERAAGLSPARERELLDAARA